MVTNGRMGFNGGLGLRTWRMAALAALLIIAWGLASAGAPKAAAAGASYYVSTTGSDSNNGTSTSTAWKTLQHAADTVPAGSTVYVMGGVYNQKLKITRSGSAAAGPITFINYASQNAVVDGTGLSVGGSEGLIDIADASYIVLKGLEVRNYATATRDLMPVGIFIHGAGSYIEVRDSYVHDIKNTATVRADLSGRDAHGIAVYGTKAPNSLNHIVLDGNTLTSLVLGSSESLVVNGNVDTFEITNNLIHDNDNIGIDVIGFEGKSPDPTYDQARNGTVSGNTVYNITSNRNPSYGKSLPNNSYAADGIYVDGGKDSVIERNFSYSNDIGIEIASEHKGKSTSNITIRNNLVYTNSYTGISMGGYDTQRGSTDNCKIVNNTLYKNDSKSLDGGQLLVQFDTRNNIVKNNVMVASSSNILIYNEYTQNSGNVVDYNLYSAPGGSAGAKWFWKNTEYGGFSAYKSGTGNDAHSLFANPQFVNVSANDYHLTQASTAIDAGSTDAAIIGTLDLDGNARVQGAAVDMGAYEYPAEGGGGDGGGSGGIVIDGNASDWSSVPALATSTSAQASTLKASTASNNLLILVQGNSLTTKSQIYINADNNTSTGFQLFNWSASGAEYLLEDGSLYQYTGNGTSWAWTFIADYNGTANYAINSTVLEVSIPYSAIGASAGNTVRLGYIWNDSTSDQLPASGGLPSFTL